MTAHLRPARARLCLLPRVALAYYEEPVLSSASAGPVPGRVLMAVNISAWSIRQPLPAIVMAIVIMFLGWVAFNKLPITRLPNVDIPIISVTITQFGAAPAELESQVT